MRQTDGQMSNTYAAY